MRLFVVVLLLFCGAESFAKDSFVGVLIDQGYITDVDNPSYTSVGLFYLTSGNAKLSAKYMNLNDGYSNMANIGLVQQISLNRKGLYSSAGMEVLFLDNKAKGYPGVSRIAPILGLGVVLTRRHFLSQIEVSVHYPRIEFNFSIGY